MLDVQTVMWKTVTILYDSTTMGDGELLKEMIMRMQKKISIIMFDISIKSVDEIFNMKNGLGKNFFVIGQHDMAKRTYNLVRLNVVYMCLVERLYIKTDSNNISC